MIVIGKEWSWSAQELFWSADCSDRQKMILIGKGMILIGKEMSLIGKEMILIAKKMIVIAKKWSWSLRNDSDMILIG